jgi:glycosyltransferase involved in cell wall biosynthesis
LNNNAELTFAEFKKRFERVPVTQSDSDSRSARMVTVCIQTYQHAGTISECLEGVLMQQTSFEYEILIGEDASSDGTRQICMKYADLYPEKIRLILHRRENNIAIRNTPTGRFNFAYNIYSARGKYIALCEGDDYWTDPLKLQKQVDFLEANSAFSMCGHLTSELYGGKITNRVLGKFWKSELTYADIAGSNLRVPTSSIVFRNQFRELPEWFFKVYGGDMALIFLNSQKGAIKAMDFIGSVYRVHPGGVEQKYKADRFLMASRNVDEYLIYRNLVDGQQRVKIDRKLAWNYFYLGLLSFKRFKLLSACNSMAKAILFKGRQLTSLSASFK